MADCVIDIYDEDMHHIGTALRSQAHREGLWHKTFHCWVVKQDNNGKRLVWVQLRGNAKNNFPNLLDISVSGHLKTGEQPKDGIREAQEELNLAIDISKLNKLFTQKIMYGDNQMNNEFCSTYMFETNKSLADLTMQPDEVDAVYEVDVTDLLNLFGGKKNSIKISGLVRNGANAQAEREVTARDFVPHGREYYLKVFETINRYFINK